MRDYWQLRSWFKFGQNLRTYKIFSRTLQACLNSDCFYGLLANLRTVWQPCTVGSEAEFWARANVFYAVWKYTVMQNCCKPAEGRNIAGASMVPGPLGSYCYVYIPVTSDANVCLRFCRRWLKQRIFYCTSLCNMTTETVVKVH